MYRVRNLRANLSYRCDPHRSKNPEGGHQICCRLPDMPFVSYVMLGQFFLVRSNQQFTRVFKFSRVLSVHKLIGYSVVSIFLVHPFLIVLPRFYESGVSPFDALITILTTFESLGVVLGLISWILMLLIGATSPFRDKLNMSYKTWKLFHGILSILFIATASGHAIELDRRTDKMISIFIILLASTGSIILIKLYASTSNKI